jgi:xanthine dehydrogenase accessory factor
MKGRVLVLGAGDMGSAVAHALHAAGWPVAIQDDPASAHPRRGMAFADALWDGRAELAGLAARRADDADALAGILATREAVAITGLPLDGVLASRPWAALVDARTRKRATPRDLRGLAPRVIGLGVGIMPGRNCDIAIETSREALGQVLRAGETLPLRGEPRAIAGVGRERAVYAPGAGVARTRDRIGEKVQAGDPVVELGPHVLRAPIAGCLRGLVRDGVTIQAAAKVVEVDPRGDPALCFGLGERPRRVADAVREALAEAIARP